MAAVTPIVALDVPNSAAALALADALGDRTRFYKVGSELYTAEGPSIVETLRGRDADVFLDLKFHDIPNTVRGAVRSAAKLGARLLTVHASGGMEMLRAAVESAHDVDGRCEILAVTILTSLDATAIGTLWGRRVNAMEDEVLRLADIAADAGAHGIVCSGQEALAVRNRFGERLATLVP